MKKKTRYSLLLILLLATMVISFYYWTLPIQKERLLISHPLFKTVAFHDLPGWNSAQLHKSFAAFKTSCKAFIKQNPDKDVGTEDIPITVKDWQPMCLEALKIETINQKTAKQFFQKWFAPMEFFDKSTGPGLFTGYYVPAIKGSLTQSKEFNVPIYETPNDLITSDLGLFFNDLKNRKLAGRLVKNKLIPYYTRAQINQGAIEGKAKVLVWINSPIDRLFLEIQGSGLIELENGENLSIGYDAQNGMPYTAIAGVLIKKGVMTRDNASMQAIKRYLTEHSDQMHKIINQNKSFVFFRKMAAGIALGAQGVSLTPGYSLAVDRQWIPLGTPLWLNTSRPNPKNPELNNSMQRLMIAQDTGGAIKGKIRGDVFWGGGERATVMAGHMKNPGHYWLLLPKETVIRLEKSSLLKTLHSPHKVVAAASLAAGGFK